MENLTVSAVYGLGLYEAARDLDKVSDLRAQLSDVACIFKQQPEFFKLLTVPTLDASDRRALADKAFSGKIDEHLLNFLYVLIDKRRIGQFDGIRKQFEKLCDQRDGVSRGKVVSAVPLTKEQISEIEDQAGKLFRKKVSLKNETDASLIGGVKLYLDGKLIDASIKTRLKELREYLT
jgi:ATP synthase F1 delta subunit